MLVGDSGVGTCLRLNRPFGGTDYDIMMFFTLPGHTCFFQIKNVIGDLTSAFNSDQILLTIDRQEQLIVSFYERRVL